MTGINSSALEKKVQVLDEEQRTVRRSLPTAFFKHQTRPAGTPQGGEEESHANQAWI